MSLGERIIELRKLSGLSQTQLAKDMDVSRQAVSKWETDQATPDPSKLIKLAEVLDTDIEYLSTGRRNFARRPPVVVKTVETVEKIVEKPVVQIVEKIVEKPVDRPVPIVKYVEKPIIKKVIRYRYRRNPFEYALSGIICFLAGLIIGLIL